MISSIMLLQEDTVQQHSSRRHGSGKNGERNNLGQELGAEVGRESKAIRTRWKIGWKRNNLFLEMDLHLR